MTRVCYWLPAENAGYFSLPTPETCWWNVLAAPYTSRLPPGSHVTSLLPVNKASYIIRNVISVLFSLHYFLYFVYLQFCINPLNTYRSYLKSWPLKMFVPALLDSYWTEWGNVNHLNSYPLKQNVFVKQYMYDPACWQRSLKKASYFSTKVKVKVTSALTLLSLQMALLVEPCQIWSLYLS